MPKEESDKRSYFRIKDEILLRWEPAQEHQLTETELGAELAQINDRLSGMINVAYSEAPVLAEAIGLINRKVDLLVGGRKTAEKSLIKVKVNLSGAGLGFAWKGPATIGDMIDITMRLQPSNLEVTLRTDVLYCDPIVGEKDEGYWIRGEFAEGQEMAVEQIVRHVSFRQTQLFAAKREEEEALERENEEWFEDDVDEDELEDDAAEYEEDDDEFDDDFK